MNDQLMLCDDRALSAMLSVGQEAHLPEARMSHIAECKHCQARLRELAADDSDWRTAAEAIAAASGMEAFPTERDAPATWSESMVKQLLNPPTHPEMLGRLGRYEIERLIGSGGMGIVFRAFDTELNRPVAVKILAPYLANSRSARKRFAREARAAAGIVDEHVVPIFNVESDGEPPFLVMQYVAGGSLQERLDRDGPLEVTDVLRIGLQTAKGLAAAHAQGLIHRDVKPSNILLDEGVERALLTDFGLARAEHEVSLTHTGFHPGTPDYMSPEQVRGEAIDARSDLFSLGCLLYALATGSPPFRAETSYAVLRKITDQEPRPIQEKRPEAPPWLGLIVTKLLAKSQANRFSSAREVAELLEQCMAHLNQPADVPLPEPLRRRPSPFRTRTIPITIRCLICAALLGTSALVVVGTGDGEGVPAVAKQPTPSKDAGEGTSAMPVTEEGEPISNKEKDKDAARREFIQLAQQLEGQFTIVPARAVPAEKSVDEATQSDDRFAKSTLPHIQVDPLDLAVHVEAMFLFEESQRGTHLGLMALRKLLLLTTVNTNDGGPTPQTRALQRLVHYADWPIVSEILFHVVNRRLDAPSTKEALQAIIDAPNVSKYVRPAAQLNLSKWMLQFEPFVANPERIQAQITALAGKEDVGSMATLQVLQQRLSAAPDAATFAEWKTQAMANLENLRDTSTEIRPPGIRASGNRNILRISHALTKENPTLAELADRTLKRQAQTRDQRADDLLDEGIEAASRQEFIRLVEIFDRQFQQRLATFFSAPAVDDQQDVDVFMANDILTFELESLLQFEEQHRGHHLGLMALRKIITHAKGYSVHPACVRSAHARAIKRLEHYGSEPMLADVLLRVSGDGRRMTGSPDPRTQDVLRALAKSPSLSESLRPIAQLALCNWTLRFDGFVSSRELISKQVEAEKRKDDPAAQHQVRATEAILAATPSEEEYAVWKEEAIDILESLEKSATHLRMPSVKVEGHRDILRIDTGTTDEQQTVSEFAAKLQELRSGNAQQATGG
ncbi:MAG: serine/threonine-protein kinase [Planctomycetota bacterium]